MVPTYGKIAIFLFIIIIFTGVGFAIYFGQIRKHQGKMIAAITMSAIPCFILFSIIVAAGADKDESEIKSKIQSIGGTIVTFQKVRPDQTPFNKPSRAKDFGDHFQVTYEINGAQHTAWFRADGAMVQIPKPPDAEKWILTK